jgi:hypothetical protein
MRDTLHRVIEVPCSSERAWGNVVDPSWLGDAGEVELVPGGEGWVIDGDGVRYIVVEEVDEPRRYVYRWASFTEEPTRVEIEVAPTPAGSLIEIRESPLSSGAQMSLCAR